MANLSSLNFRLSANISPFQKGLNKAERSMDKLGRKMQQTGKNLSMSLTAPIAALGAMSFSVFKGFEAEMSKVQAVSGATAEEFKALSDNAKELGASTMFSAREVAGLQSEFAKLGFTATEITKVTEATLALAQASGSDLPRAAMVAGSTLRAFGLDASQTGMVTDVMAKSFSTSAMDMDTFAESMKYVAPVAKSAGMSIQETSAMLSVLANAGIKGSQAGTALRRIISEIGASGKPTAEALKDLAAQGLNLADAKDEVGRSAQSALLVLAGGVDQIAPLTKEFENSAGAAKAMADIMGDTAFGASKRLESAMEGLGISIGEIISVAVVPLIESLAKAASALNGMSKNSKTTIVIIAALTAAIGPLLFVIGGLIRNFILIKNAIKSFGIAANFATIKTKALAIAQKITNAVMKANPYVLVAAALVTLGSAIGGSIVMYRSLKKRQDETRDSTKLTTEEIEKQTLRLQELRDVSGQISEKSATKNLRPIERELKLMEARGASEQELHDKKIQLLNQRKLEIIKQQAFLFDDAEKQKEFAQDILDVEAEIAIERIEYQKKIGGSIGETGEKTEQANTSVSGLTAKIATLGLATGAMTMTFAKSNDELDQGIDKMDRMILTAMALSDQLSELANKALVDVAVGFADMAGQAMVGAASFADLGRFAIDSLAGLMMQVGQIAIQTGIAVAGIKVAIQSLNPAVAIAGGLALIALAGAIRGKMSQVSSEGGSIPAMAEGGIVTGPTLALIGEGRESEAVIPLSKLNTMMQGGGSQNVVVTGRISGADILLSNERASRTRTRQRGF